MNPYISQISEPTLTILRGGPGSGKTYLANKLEKIINDSVIIKSGDFLADTKEQQYNMLHDFLKDAMQKKTKSLIVDDNILSFEDIKPFLILSKAMQYNVNVVDVTTPWHLNAKECSKKTNKYNLSQITEMINKFNSQNTVIKQVYDYNIDEDEEYIERLSEKLKKVYTKTKHMLAYV